MTLYIYIYSFTKSKVKGTERHSDTFNNNAYCNIEKGGSGVTNTLWKYSHIGLLTSLYCKHIVQKLFSKLYLYY